MNTTWRISSYSNASGGNCVGVGTTWRKSSYSAGGADNCVEVAEGPAAVYVRDTQNRDLGMLAFPASEFAAFLMDLKAERR